MRFAGVLDFYLVCFFLVCINYLWFTFLGLFGIALNLTCLVEDWFGVLCLFADLSYLLVDLILRVWVCGFGFFYIGLLG